MQQAFAYVRIAENDTHIENIIRSTKVAQKLTISRTDRVGKFPYYTRFFQRYKQR